MGVRKAAQTAADEQIREAARRIEERIVSIAAAAVVENGWTPEQATDAAWRAVVAEVPVAAAIVVAAREVV